MSRIAFELACAEVKQLKCPLSDEEKLVVYSYYKQATVGDVNIPCPEVTDLKARAKWEAWNCHKGMSQIDARKIYVSKVKELKKRVCKEKHSSQEIVVEEEDDQEEY